MPRLLYLLQALPIKIPQTFFHVARSVYIKFIWRGKHPRLGRALLLRPKLKGRVGSVLHCSAYDQGCGLVLTQCPETLGIAGTRSSPSSASWPALGRENPRCTFNYSSVDWPHFNRTEQVFPTIYIKQFPFTNDSDCRTPWVCTQSHRPGFPIAELAGTSEGFAALTVVRLDAFRNFPLRNDPS